jgi:flagellar P-ring protein precursor FlgI
MVDSPARVIIDEVNGVIVMGDAVRVSTVAIAQGNLTISVQESPYASQPQPFGRGETVVVPETNVAVEEELGREMRIVDGGASLATLVNGLNALGVSPRDMISILQAIKAAGALQAEIEVM